MRELVIKDKVLCSGRKPLVCVPLIGHTNEQLMEHLDRIIQESERTSIDIVEFRGDFYDNLQKLEELENILLKIRELLSDKILLFTIRSPREGGEKVDYCSKSIEEINEFVIDKALADMVDIELFATNDNCSKSDVDLIALAKERNVKIIMSNHDFEKTPHKEEIVSRLIKMQQLGADVAKIAVMPNDEEDLITLLQATLEMLRNHNNTPVVTMSMGAKGALSRVAGEIFGSAFTFGAVGEVSAPGQIPVDKLNDMLDSMHYYCVEG